MAAMRTMYHTTISSVEGLLEGIRHPDRQQEWGYANTESYLATLATLLKTVKQAVNDDGFASDYFANVDRKKEMGAAEYDIACARCVAAIDLVLTDLKIEGGMIRSTHAGRLAQASKKSK